MAFEIILPVADRNAEIQVRTRRHVWKALPAKPVIGLIDNTKTYASDILELVARKLVACGFADSWFTIRKSSSGNTMTEDDLAELVLRADMVVAGIGD